MSASCALVFPITFIFICKFFRGKRVIAAHPDDRTALFSIISECIRVKKKRESEKFMHRQRKRYQRTRVDGTRCMRDEKYPTRLCKSARGAVTASIFRRDNKLLDVVHRCRGSCVSMARVTDEKEKKIKENLRNADIPIFCPYKKLSLNLPLTGSFTFTCRSPCICMCM